MSCENTYKNFNIYKNKILNPKDTIFCLNAIDSMCVPNLTLKECINLCENDPDCTYGQYVKDKEEKNRSLCAAIVDENYTKDILYNLRDKNIYQEIYPQIDNLDTFFFSKDCTIFPEDGNKVFKGDNFYLVSKNHGRIDTIEDKKPISLSDLGGVLQILRGYDESIPIQFGDGVSFTNFEGTNDNICKTCETNRKQFKSSLVIENDNDVLIGRRHRNWIDQINQRFRILPLKGEDIGEILTYYTEFYMKSFVGDGLITYKDGELISSNILAKENKPEDISDTIFYMIPNNFGFYCENKECKKIKLSKTTHEGEKAFVEIENQKLPVYRKSDCFGVCDYNCENSEESINKELSISNKNYSWLIALFASLAIVVTLILIIFYIYF